MLDRRHLLDPISDHGVWGSSGRHAVGHLGRRPDRLAREHDEALGETRSVDRQGAEAFADLERDALDVVLEDGPAVPVTGLETPAAVDERALVLVREVLCAVEATVDPQIALPPTEGDRLGLLDRGPRGARQQAADPEPGPERAEHDAGGPEGDHTRQNDEEGLHEAG